ncbi:MAG: hypothetical protein HPY44_04010 [Armatimonadetes bacterium]|nr:hypothetical protein [Armatimonadota bacterium]
MREYYTGDAMWDALREWDGAGPSGGLLTRLAAFLDGQGCRTLWVEHNALDEEYFREFLHFYATTFMEHPPTATRLHFFSAPLSRVRSTLDPVRTGVTRRELDSLGYLGYVVLRPTSPVTVGETLLAAPKELRGAKCYNHCATVFGQTLGGRRLHVASAPFIGQEQTGVCAHSAIWGALKYLHKYRYYPKLSMPDIAILATEHQPDSRFTRPAEGLTTQAMYSVFRQLGFQIFYTDHNEWDNEIYDPLEATYTCVESGLPVLVGLYIIDEETGLVVDGHAVWATGHTSSENLEPRLRKIGPAEDDPKYLSTCEWAAHILIHDDNAGPYVPACITHSPENLISHPELRNYLKMHHRIEYAPYGDHQESPASPYSGKILALSHVFAPLPEEVFVKPPEAKRLALYSVLGEHLDAILDQLDADHAEGHISWPVPGPTREFAAARLDPERYAYRTFLCQSARYAEHAASSASMPSQLKRLYARTLRLPEYVWVTEICNRSVLDAHSSHGSAVVGEVLIDSTDSSVLRAQGSRYHYLAMHIPGLIVFNPSICRNSIWRSNGSQEMKLLPVDDPGTYEAYSKDAETEDPPRSHRKLGPIRHTLL